MSVTTDFDDWLAKAWDDHAADSVGVAGRIASQGLATVGSVAQLSALARLAHHVLGEHLGQWSGGRALLGRLRAHPLCEATAMADLGMLDASLALGEGIDLRSGMTASHRVRVGALAAGNLASRDTRRAATLLQEALAEADASELAGADPALRALAVTGNNLACTLEDKAVRSDDERDLMILAARTARHYWERVGGWLETERAEYRLAHTWLKAGDAMQAGVHARACLALVQAHDAPALEHFFAWEAIALAAKAAGHASVQADALSAMQEAFQRLDDDDRAGCQPTLDAAR
jgi:hypothetical protein